MEPLGTLFNASLRSGVFPAVWKHTFITPIFKGGDRSDCAFYRGIAILSAIPKLFEKIVCDHLEPAFRFIIDPSQHGCRAGHSTCTNLTLFVDDVLNAMGKSFQVDAVYTDFAKAFDRVNHQLLINKLNLYGVSGKLLT